MLHTDDEVHGMWQASDRTAPVSTPPSTLSKETVMTEAINEAINNATPADGPVPFVQAVQDAAQAAQAAKAAQTSPADVPEVVVIRQVEPVGMTSEQKMKRLAELSGMTDEEIKAEWYKKKAAEAVEEAVEARMKAAEKIGETTEATKQAAEKIGEATEATKEAAKGWFKIFGEKVSRGAEKVKAVATDETVWDSVIITAAVAVVVFVATYVFSAIFGVSMIASFLILAAAALITAFFKLCVELASSPKSQTSEETPA